MRLTEPILVTVLLMQRFLRDPSETILTESANRVFFSSRVN